MEGFGGAGFSGVSSFKRPRSTTSRRPRPDSQFGVGLDVSPPPSTPSSDNASKLSPDDQNAGHDASFRRKEYILNSSAPRVASINKIEGTGTSKKIRKEDKKFGDVSGFYGNGGSRGAPQSGISDHGRNGSDLKRCSEGVLAPANWKSASKVKESYEMQSRAPDGHNLGQSVGATSGLSENKLRKVKLKVGGVTRTIHAKSNSENDNSGSSAKPSRSLDASRHRQKLILQDNSDDDSPTQKGDDLQGVPWRDFSGGFPRGAKEGAQGKVMEENLSAKQMPFSEPVRKSKRVPKRRVLDGEFEEGDEDDEIRYLEKLKNPRVGTDYNSEFEDAEESAKKKKISKVSKSRKSGYYMDEDYGSLRLAKENRKKLRTGRESDDTDYFEEEELGSDDGTDAKRKKQKKEPVETLTDTKVEPLTTRQRALQSGKGAAAGGSLIEFPNGLPPAPPRKQKEKLSEEEQLAKKAEAAQRRRMQVEKAARESEAEAIRKILGQDSNRKKKEDKLRKERDEKAQKRAAESLVLPSNTIRWVMGPTGTTVTFGEDVGLPSIFELKTSNYPPPREKCAGPSCTNTYKYRDSKLNLPLCSLQCYKAIQEKAQPVSTW